MGTDTKEMVLYSGNLYFEKDKGQIVAGHSRDH